MAKKLSRTSSKKVAASASSKSKRNPQAKAKPKSKKKPVISKKAAQFARMTGAVIYQIVKGALSAVTGVPVQQILASDDLSSRLHLGDSAKFRLAGEMNRHFALAGMPLAVPLTSSDTIPAKTVKDLVDLVERTQA
jgi:hypothetical protein